MQTISGQWNAGAVIRPRNINIPKLRTIIVPENISWDIVDSVKKAVAKIRPISDKSRYNGEYLGVPVRKLNNKAPYNVVRPTTLSTRIFVETKDQKAKRVKRELLDAGITIYGLIKAESRYLPKVLHNREHVEAVVYGQHHSSSVMLVATDERIIFLDKKPMALFLDEVSYEVISGIQFEIHTVFASLTLHTPVKNYDIRMANLRCAENFARHIEAHRLKREENDVEPATIDIVPKRHHLEDMAGYYWLPTPEEDEEERLALKV